MLTAPLLRRRITGRLYLCGSRFYTAPGTRRGQGSRASNAKESSKPRERAGGGNVSERPPSLMEQLFPEEAKRQEEEAKRKPTPEVPRLPLEDPANEPFIRVRIGPDQPAGEYVRSRASRELEAQIGRDDGEVTVLLLRAASLHLTEADFRRLLPRGQHLEGWQLQQDHLLKVIPGRNLETLEPLAYYYVLFSSRLSAFTYQGHVIRLHRFVQQHTPSSLTSPIPPPPGYTVNGTDVHEAIRIFTLVPASQNLEFRLLKAPLTPFVQDLARNQGYASLLNRANRMPFEVRLTLEGPQLTLQELRALLLSSARVRALSWSGSDDPLPVISRWDPVETPSPMDFDSRDARRFVEHRERQMRDAQQGGLGAEGPGRSFVAEDAQTSGFRTLDLDALQAPDPLQGSQQIGRTARAVYIIGFATEDAAQTFLRYWHRRHMIQPTDETGPGFLAPVADVSMLW